MQNSPRAKLPLRWSVLGMLGVVLFVSACGGFRREDPTETASVVFVNESVDQAEVFAVVPAISNVRLGIVMQGERRTLVVPSRVVRQGQNVNIVARIPARGTQANSGPVLLRPGDEVRLTLPVAATHLIVETGRR